MSLTSVFTFTWNIEHFRMCPLKKGECLCSPTFKVSSLQETKWRLKLYPRDGNGMFPSLYLFRAGDESEPESVTVGYSLSLIAEFERDPESGDGVTRIVAQSDSTRFRKNEGTASDGFLGLGAMIHEEDEFLVRGSLVVRCCLWPAVFTDDTTESAPGNEILRGGESEFDVVDWASWFPSPSGRRLYGEWSHRCSARTRVSRQRRIVNWSIEDFDSLELGRELHRPPPTDTFADESKLSLSLQKLAVSEDAIRLGFRVQVKDEPFWRVFAKLELFVHDDAGNVFTVYDDEHFFERLDEVWSFPLTIETRSNGIEDVVLTRSGQLVLRFVFAISRKKPDFSCSGDEKYLKGELRRLYKCGKFCDVTIRTSDRTFSVHKIVLCARSDVFCAMFENSTKERDTGVVDIVDVDSDTLERMLDFMYTDELDIVGEEDALRLYTATDKYQVRPLNKLCASFLVAGLSASSVCDVMELAELHQDTVLKNSVKDFIYVNAKEVLSSCSWVKFMETNSRLAGEIMHHILVKKL